MNSLRIFASLGALALFASAALAQTAQEAEFFEAKVRPILVNKCQSCHGPDKQKGGLRLDSREAIMQGSDGGPVILQKEPEKSLLLKAIRHEGDVKMPKDKLPD